MQKVLISPAPLATMPGPYRDILTESGFELVFPPRRAQMTEAETIESLQGLKAVVAGSERYTPKVLDALPDLKVIARVGVGYDAVNIPHCTEKGIVVAYAPGANNQAVAEQTLMAVLVLAKSLMTQDAAIRQGLWPRQGYLPVRGATLGIVGLGRIGKAVTVRAKAFRMNVIACDPVVDESFNRAHDVTMLNFEEVLAKSDYLTFHVPSLPSTYKMIRSETLKLMKPTAFLINTSRGPVVNETDLVEALEKKKLAGAALDVFDPEPPPANHPLYKFSNVILTAHTAGVDQQALQDLAYSAAASIVKLSQGEWPAEQIVNGDVRAKFKW